MRRPSHVVERVLWIVSRVSGGEGCTSYLGACPTLTFLLRRTICDHLRRSQAEKILNIFQRIRIRFFRTCGLASGRTSFASSRTAMSDRLLADPEKSLPGSLTRRNVEHSPSETFHVLRFTFHEQLRRRGSSIRLIVAAGAEWVRAPIEMRSGPAAAIARMFFRVMPPETSTSARPLMSFTACLTVAGVILSRRT